MDKLKVAFLNFWPEIKDENIFLPILQKHFNVEINLTNPDVIFHSIFGGIEETKKYKCKKILFLGENHRSQNFGSDYSISFDPHSETNYRLPLWQFYLILRPELKNILFGPRINHESFDRGGSFVVSNPGNFFRNAFYDKMVSESSIKFYSYGRYKTNSFDLIKASQGRYWRDAKHEFFLKYKHKYAIAFENNAYPYYCTEKLMDAFLGGSLPLYWGDPKINEDWNFESFINVTKLGADKSYNIIKDMEKNNDLFVQMYKQPIFTDEQKEKHLSNINNFENWLINIIKNG